MVTVTCPKCGELLRTPDERGAGPIVCPMCGASISTKKKPQAKIPPTPEVSPSAAFSKKPIPHQAEAAAPESHRPAIVAVILIVLFVAIAGTGISLAVYLFKQPTLEPPKTIVQAVPPPQPPASQIAKPQPTKKERMLALFEQQITDAEYPHVVTFPPPFDKAYSFKEPRFDGKDDRPSLKGLDLPDPWNGYGFVEGWARVDGDVRWFRVVIQEDEAGGTMKVTEATRVRR